MIESVSTNDRAIFFLVWQDHETPDEMQEHGFAAASSLNMPVGVGGTDADILLFEGIEGSPTFMESRYANDNVLLVRPSLRTGRDSTLAFYRNNSYFCIGTIKEGVDVNKAINQLGNCCQEEGCP